MKIKLEATPGPEEETVEEKVRARCHRGPRRELQPELSLLRLPAHPAHLH